MRTSGLGWTILWLAAAFAGGAGCDRTSTPSLRISGTVTGPGAAGVAVVLSGAALPEGRTATTDASGGYSFLALPPGSYLVTPSRAGYVLAPASKDVELSSADATGVDFTAAVATRVVTVSGGVRYWPANGSTTLRPFTGMDLVLRQVAADGTPTDYPLTPGAAPGTWTAALPAGPYVAVTNPASTSKSRVRYEVPSGADLLRIEHDWAGRDPELSPLTYAYGYAYYDAAQVAAGDMVYQGSWDLGTWTGWHVFSPSGAGSTNRLWTPLDVPVGEPRALFEFRRTTSIRSGLTFTTPLIGRPAGVILDPPAWNLVEVSLEPPTGPGVRLPTRIRGPLLAEALAPAAAERISVELSAAPTWTCSYDVGTGLGSLGATIFDDASLDPIEVPRYTDPAWPVYRRVVTQGAVTRTPPGTGTPESVQVWATALDAYDAAVTDVAPRLSVPRNLRIGGRDAMAPLTGLGTAPVVTWDPPATGTATLYQVYVDPFTRGWTGSNLFTATVFGTSVTVPPETFAGAAAGDAFIVFVVAVDDPSLAGGATPLRQGPPPRASATMVSETFSP